MRQEYSIVARRGKKGTVYYVRFFLDGKMVPSQWSTGTGNFREAQVFAAENKERILKKYFGRKEGKTLYAVLRNYYAKGSDFLAIDTVRGRKLNENSRKILHGFILNTFIPFLLKTGIKEFGEIKPAVINRFQNYLLLEKNLLPQSINRQISGIKSIFSHLYMTGMIEHNTLKDIAPLKPMNSAVRGCHSIDMLSGIFKNRWDDLESYLLCALIYTAGLRNSEIKQLRPRDIINIDSVSFLNIKSSKTISGVRKVPLHSKVKESLAKWIETNRISEGEYLFVKNTGRKLDKAAQKANLLLGSLLKKDSAALQAENITFYSGRHFYKTMLNSADLGDIEELFMGHKVGRDVSERYNHKDKRGAGELLKAAGKALEIIDKTFFR
jgi:integrase